MKNKRELLKGEIIFDGSMLKDDKGYEEMPLFAQLKSTYNHGYGLQIFLETLKLESNKKVEFDKDTLLNVGLALWWLDFTENNPDREEISTNCLDMPIQQTLNALNAEALRRQGLVQLRYPRKWKFEAQFTTSGETAWILSRPFMNRNQK